MEIKDVVIEDIENLLKYDMGWFEDLSLPASTKAITDAISFIEKVPNLNKRPYVSLANDGEVNFYWKYDDVEIDLGFYGDGTYSYYVKSNLGELHENSIPLDKDIPSYILLNI